MLIKGFELLFFINIYYKACDRLSVESVLKYIKEKLTMLDNKTLSLWIHINVYFNIKLHISTHVPNIKNTMTSIHCIIHTNHLLRDNNISNDNLILWSNTWLYISSLLRSQTHIQAQRKVFYMNGIDEFSKLIQCFFHVANKIVVIVMEWITFRPFCCDSSFIWKMQSRRCSWLQGHKMMS